ncbi:MAG: solute-binding protein [Desulfobacteraceae bacterium]|nr:substrate-binding domain-containing protein [Desulfobacteraceae bacterium]MBC2754779.1 solute-binding protein [Desulfobacteraceae bacterium]
MKNNFLKIAIILCVIFLSCTSYAEEKILKMSTTTSTQDSGLLDAILPVFHADTGIKVKVIAKGTGAAIRDGMDGNVDIIFVHAREREEKFIAEGFGTRRYAIMHNDFVVIGPKKDPAKIDGSNDATAAFKKIAESKSSFVSRGDDSGTHTKEQKIWTTTGVPMITETKEIIKKGKTSQITFNHPKGMGEWYLSIGQGMGATITFSEEKQTYTLSDRGTYLAYKYGRKQGLDLDILCEGDAQLKNEYGLIPLNPTKFPHARYELAKQFADWITSPKGQSLIADYKIYGKQLFYPDAVASSGSQAK